MKIILTADVPQLGGPGDLVQVKDGYARNYLLPRHLAIVATKGAEKQVATIRRAQQARQIRDLDHAREVAGSLSGLGTVTVTAKAARSGGKLFGSITAADVVDAVRAAGGPPLDKRAVDLGGHIKSAGTYQATVRLHPDVSVTVPLKVTTAD
ncbi:MAG: 50S ribosomal protein L9 [Pseudonocardiales bacterium]|nr:50S ribosomal protein L9 [Pseudonocardiales bacterium]MBV9650484.1 50S ribosomal protein L9 [Pseudonocardiales bacterium]